MNRLKTPRRNCKSASAWRRYYEVMAAWHEDAAAVVELTMPGTPPAAHSREGAACFARGAKEIADGTPPVIGER